MFYNRYLPVHDPGVYAVDRNYLVAQVFGFEEVPVLFHIPTADQWRDEAIDLLHSAGLADSKKMVLMVPGARWETKRWPPARFSETIDRLQSEDDVRCVLVGSGAELPLCRSIASSCRWAPINLAGMTGIEVLTALVKLAKVVLCQDSAAMHLAVALDRPLVCLMGPTNPERTGPYRRKHDVLRLDLKCSPCYLRKLAQCPHDHRCMQELEAARVVAALRCAMTKPATTATMSPE